MASNIILFDAISLIFEVAFHVSAPVHFRLLFDSRPSHDAYDRRALFFVLAVSHDGILILFRLSLCIRRHRYRRHVAAGINVYFPAIAGNHFGIISRRKYYVTAPLKEGNIIAT